MQNADTNVYNIGRVPGWQDDFGLQTRIVEECVEVSGNWGQAARRPDGEREPGLELGVTQRARVHVLRSML